jgi:cell division transport system permease protein
MTLVTIGTMAVVFLILGVFALAGYNLSILKDKLGENLRLTVFLNDQIGQAEQDGIYKVLTESQTVLAVKFVSRDHALEIFKKKLGPHSSLLQGLDENPLPASYEVSFKPDSRSPDSIGKLAQLVVNLSGVEEARYGQAWLQKVFNVFKSMGLFGLLIGGLIGLAALVIVSNTIRLSVYARRDEIEILKLVGATNGFVKVPFYIEGVLLGSFGACLGIGLLWLVVKLVLPYLMLPLGLFQSSMAIEFLPFAYLAAILAGSACLGVFGTSAAIWRYLKI